MAMISKEDEVKVKNEFNTFKHANFSNTDLNTVLDNTSSILKKSSSGSLGNFFDDIKTMCEMVKAWAKKEYKGVPSKTIVAVILTLIYIFSPADIIPDTIPGIGLIDDATMVKLCINAVRSDIQDFRVWARTHMKK